ncbi:Hypp2746 [Branchiostoma lanceolatum]|uniref:Hypp2746 protein n=1 Tax=Branchiostoma lanceolatum TaxID=7740 RepID=A0A8J9ZU70_BRALA|nr:Hypp2746 [Branchiostoma lanceolatum]
MAKSLAFKLQQLESRLCTGDGLEVGYSRILRDAIADNDSQLQTEALKYLGDLHLERGKIDKDVKRFDNAADLYEAAFLPCTDTDGREAIEHRIRYVERLASKVPRKSVITEHGDNENDIRTFQNSVLRVAYTCLTLDRTQAQCEGDLSSLRDVYTKTLKAGFMKKTLRLRKENTFDDDPLWVITSSQTAEDSRSYREHYSQGKRAMKTGKLDLAEQQFASALKIVHGKEPTTLQLEAECLYKMGNVYLERGEMTKEGADFTKATALYNAALASGP